MHQQATPEEAAESGKHDSADRIRCYSRYLLFILFLVGLLNFIDRQILLILIEPIRRDLGLSDTQIGLLTGFAFAIVYATGGLAIARIADSTSRRLVLGIAILVWSGMTTLGSLAQTFWHLALARLGVAAGEAAATPSAHGLIAEHFPEHRRALAISIFSLATPCGTMLGFAGGGWLAGHFHWRTVFLMVGLPGLLLGIVQLLTVRDNGVSKHRNEIQSMRTHAIGTLLRRPSFVHVVIAFTFVAIAGYGFAAFQAPFFIRLYGFTSAEAGLAIGLLYGISGGAGTLVGGILADSLGKRDPRWRLWLPALGMMISAVLMGLALTASDGRTSAWLMVVPQFSGMLYLAPCYGVAQTLASPASRSMASAIILCAAGLIGGGFGPLMVGAVSDALSSNYGSDALRYACLLIVPTQLLAAWFLYAGGRALPADMKKPLA